MNGSVILVARPKILMAGALEATGEKPYHKGTKTQRFTKES
jgi:hypothetical protein